MKHAMTAAVAAAVTAWVVRGIELPAPTIAVTFVAFWAFGTWVVSFARGEGLL
jgi:hypothetical protein